MGNYQRLYVHSRFLGNKSKPIMVLYEDYIATYSAMALEKMCLIHIKILLHNIILVLFGLVGFYGIATTVGYFMPKPVNTYIC